MPLPDFQQPLRFGSLSLPSRFFLAPLAGYTNLAYRTVVRDSGGLGLATTDLVNARSLIEKNPKAFALIETRPEDRPLAVQIFGAVQQELCAAAQLLESMGVAMVDLNMGCPAVKVVRNGGGSAMMRDTDKTIAMVHALVESVKIPVTVKMRLGWDDQNITAPFFARQFEQAGVAAITIHGRTRAQGFGGVVNIAGIRQVVESVERIPIVGNGDIRTVEDVRVMFEQTGCAAVSVGRGALLNPWVFRQSAAVLVRGEPLVRPTYQEHVSFMVRHFEALLAIRQEKVACCQFRKVGKWYCRALRPPKWIQRELLLVKTAAEFAGLITQLRDMEPRPGESPVLEEPTLPVPKGPCERW